MRKILVVEDSAECAFLLVQLIELATTDAVVVHTNTLEDALPRVEWADLVITDFEFPSLGFPALLPVLKKTNRKFILQTAGIEHIKNYDPILQLAAICKGTDYTRKMLSTLRNLNN